jgi:hypothetical protein
MLEWKPRRAPSVVAPMSVAMFPLLVTIGHGTDIGNLGW